MPNLTLYEISNTYRDLLDRYDMVEDQEALDAIATELHSIDDAFTDKSRAIIALIRESQLSADAIDEEAKRLKSKADSARKKADWLKRYLEGEMEMLGMPKIDVGIAKAWIQNNAPSVIISDETKIPGDYFRVIPETREVDKRSIIDALKSGEEIPGAELHISRSIRIR